MNGTWQIHSETSKKLSGDPQVAGRQENKIHLDTPEQNAEADLLSNIAIQPGLVQEPTDNTRMR